MPWDPEIWRVILAVAGRWAIWESRVLTLVPFAIVVGMSESRMLATVLLAIADGILESVGVVVQGRRWAQLPAFQWIEELPAWRRMLGRDSSRRLMRVSGA